MYSRFEKIGNDPVENLEIWFTFKLPALDKYLKDGCFKTENISDCLFGT